LTSYADYAVCYSKAAAEKILVLSLVIPGNIYPVTEQPSDINLMTISDEESSKAKKKPAETLLGKPCKNGYQSHYAYIYGHRSEGRTFGWPCTDPHWKGTKYDELVIFQDAQAVPKYVIYVK